MKKYICPNCGFTTGLRTVKDAHKRTCKICNAQVYNSKKVLASIMRIELLKGYMGKK